jgi:hypothetical protein
MTCARPRGAPLLTQAIRGHRCASATMTPRPPRRLGADIPVAGVPGCTKVGILGGQSWAASRRHCARLVAIAGRAPSFEPVRTCPNTTVAWRKGGDAPGFQPPRNLTSAKRYHGINFLLLTLAGEALGSPYWLTFRHALERGGHVRKGEKGILCTDDGAARKIFGALPGAPPLSGTLALLRALVAEGAVKRGAASALLRKMRERGGRLPDEEV